MQFFVSYLMFNTGPQIMEVLNFDLPKSISRRKMNYEAADHL
jgi:hypothetical protein